MFPSKLAYDIASDSKVGEALMQFARSQGGHNTAVAVQVVLDVENAKIAQAVFDPDAKNTPLRKAIRGAIHRWMTGNHVREDQSLAEAVAVAVMPLVSTPLGGAMKDARPPGQAAEPMRAALQEIAAMTFDPWTSGARAGEIARAAIAKATA